MKFFACIVFAAVLALAAAEGDREERSAYAAPSYAPAPVHAGPAKSYTYASPAPHVPCGKNLLFSCAPSVAPVPCQAPAYHAPSYGHAEQSYSAPSGAYSQYVPRYALPSGAPAYPQFAPQYPTFRPYY